MTWSVSSTGGTWDDQQDTERSPRVLIAGLGDVFLGDDGFGVEVSARLAGVDLPEWVQLADYGVGHLTGSHVPADLLGDYDTTVLVDVTPRGGTPGTVYLIEPHRDEPTSGERREPAGSLDAHGMRPDAVLRLLDLLGAGAGRVLVVGCEPERTGRGTGLSEPVAAAVDEAVRLVTELAWGANPEIHALPAPAHPRP